MITFFFAVFASWGIYDGKMGREARFANVTIVLFLDLPVWEGIRHDGFVKPVSSGGIFGFREEGAIGLRNVFFLRNGSIDHRDAFLFDLN